VDDFNFSLLQTGRRILLGEEGKLLVGVPVMGASVFSLRDDCTSLSAMFLWNTRCLFRPNSEGNQLTQQYGREMWPTFFLPLSLWRFSSAGLLNRSPYLGQANRGSYFRDCFLGTSNIFVSFVLNWISVSLYFPE
jgi:hypothetical protein